MGMKKGRIDAIRTFADKVADHVNATADRRLFRALAFEPPRELRRRLLQVQRDSAARALLFGLDEYTNVWCHEEGDEYLVRDLVCIRVVERLHELGYFAQHPEDAIDATTEEKEAAQ